jgi:N-ethylmaleimide reductase
LLAEVVQAVAREAGPGRTGVRLSPANPGNGAPLDSDPQAVYGRAVERIAPLKLAYLHVIEGQTRGDRQFGGFDYGRLRAAFGGPWMVNNGYDRALALETVEGGGADLVAFGRPFIGNPDLGRRLREGLPWADSDRTLYYASGPRGYTDYPPAP